MSSNAWHVVFCFNWQLVKRLHRLRHLQLLVQVLKALAIFAFLCRKANIAGTLRILSKILWQRRSRVSKPKSVLVALIAYAFMRTWSGHVSGLDGLVSLESMTKTWRIGNSELCLTTHGCMCSLGSFQWWHKFWMLKKLSQLSRRIRQRRAAQRRAQRKATGTLLTALRPASHCGLWSWVLFGI